MPLPSVVSSILLPLLLPAHSSPAPPSPCRNATLVTVGGRTLLIEQSDASADAVRIRSVPCRCVQGKRLVPAACGGSGGGSGGSGCAAPFADGPSRLPGALLRPTTPWCAGSPRVLELPARNRHTSGAGADVGAASTPGTVEPLPGVGGNLRVLLSTGDGRLRFERRADGALLTEEVAPHRFTALALGGQAPSAHYTSLVREDHPCSPPPPPCPPHSLSLSLCSWLAPHILLGAPQVKGVLTGV
jgi:hypothetical protein